MQAWTYEQSLILCLNFRGWVGRQILKFGTTHEFLIRHSWYEFLQRNIHAAKKHYWYLLSCLVIYVQMFSYRRKTLQLLLWTSLVCKKWWMFCHRIHDEVDANTMGDPTSTYVYQCSDVRHDGSNKWGKILIFISYHSIRFCINRACV